MPAKKEADPLLLRFGARVKARRIEFGWSQEDLAEAADLHRTFVVGIETGRRNPTVTSLLKLFDALDLSPNDLLTGLTPRGKGRGRS